MTVSDADPAELERLASELPELELLPDDWAAIESALDDVARETPGAVDRLSQLVFEARVSQRFHGGRAASTLPPTKRVSALPWVGLACGVVVLAVGGALGGGLVLAGVAALSLGVFAVAFAGSKVAHRSRRRDHGGENASREDEPTPDPIPDTVDERLRQLTQGRQQ